MADCPATVSPSVGTELENPSDSPVGISDVLEQVVDHPVSEEFPQNRTAAVTVS
jgi:hypothetical protein